MDYTRSSRLETKFCGKTLINPFLISASPSSDSRSKVERAFQAGWAGVVFKTTALPEYAPVLAEPNMAGIDFQNKKQIGFLNTDLISERDVYEIAEDIRYFKKKYPDRILMGSIMAAEKEHWEKLVEVMEDAGADMIELSMSCPQGEQSIAGDAEYVTQRIPASDPELMYSTTKTIKNAVKHGTPVIVKMTPNVTDIAALAKAAENAGADGLCAIDTLRGFIGVDINTGLPKLNTAGLATWGGLSGPILKPVALAAITKILSVCPDLPIAGVGGITTWEDAAEFLLLGASALEVCTAISMYGLNMVKKLCENLDRYMEEKDYSSIESMRGASLKYIVEHSALSRELHVKCRIDENKCIKCGKCAVCCNDFGFEALHQKEPSTIPVLDTEKCRGCGACSSVCPAGAVTYC